MMFEGKECERLNKGGARIISETSISSGLASGRHRHFRPITSGVVLDHVPAGRGITIRLLLGDPRDSTTVSQIVENLKSRRLGRKDAIVLEECFPPDGVFWALSFLWPEITVNIMRDGVHIKLKYDASVRATMAPIFPCPNPDCATNQNHEARARNNFSATRGEEGKVSAECGCCGQKFAKEEALTALSISRHGMI